ncbi:MAG TPA: PfkB family carbohydrate kinase [Acidimicrobiia bacterium]|nr:PfkB family carbohydrate kinase [Acidimicrobiia bacterium]
MASSIGVVSPSLIVTVTIEAKDGNQGDEVHLHPGGQGFWIARMIEHLGETPVLCAPVGGEVGLALGSLMPSNLDLWPVETHGESPIYIHDRRSGERVTVAETSMPLLSRHEQDDFFSRALEVAMATDLLVVTGRYFGGGISVDFFTRLAADLSALEVPIVADVHGEELDALLEGGSLHLLKLSQDDLVEDGRIEGVSEIAEAVDTIRNQGARNVVVSGAEGATLACLGDSWYRVEQPTLQVADHRGSGDSMTAALAVAIVRGMDEVEMLSLGAAAGAANVVRHGLGNADRDLIVQLAGRIEVLKIRGPNDDG